MVMFHYYLLGGDTAVPSWLYARLCHTFLVLYMQPTQNRVILESACCVSVIFPLSPIIVNIATQAL